MSDIISQRAALWTTFSAVDRRQLARRDDAVEAAAERRRVAFCAAAAAHADRVRAGAAVAGAGLDFRPLRRRLDLNHWLWQWQRDINAAHDTHDAEVAAAQREYGEWLNVAWDAHRDALRRVEA